MPAPLIAVLTGDIVGSSELDTELLDGALAVLGEAAARAAGWTGGLARFTRFRGDGWQCIGPSPALALRTTLVLRAHLRARSRELDSRISVGIGPGDLPAGAGLAAASGPAFRVAGHGLDQMGRAPRLAVAWAEPRAGEGMVQAIFALADELSRRWTQRQARVFAEALAPRAPTQDTLAGGLGISQQMIAKHLRAGGQWALERALSAVEAEE